MRQRGRLTDWDDEKGYGFITPTAGGPRVFVHISSFPRWQGRPAPNESITYRVTRDGQDRLRAEEARIRGSSRLVLLWAGGLDPALVVTVTFFGLLAGLVWLRLAPPAVLGYYAILSAVTFALYGLDKAAAKGGSRRTAEATLHLFELAGGWPGALAAQRVFRHKTRKRPFRIVFWCAAIANGAALLWILFANEAASLRIGLGSG